MREVKGRLDDVDPVATDNVLQNELRRIREQRADLASARISFGDYALSLLERKVLANEISSAKSRERWASTLKPRIIPFFGEFWLDQIRRATILAWKEEVDAAMAASAIGPVTHNGWFDNALRST